MSADITEKKRIGNVITEGRAYVRMIGAADVLLDHRLAWTERALLRLMQALYLYRLRGLVAVLPSDIMG